VTDDASLQRRTAEIAIETDRADARRSGVVRWYSQEKGYGFLAPDDGGEDVFVRYSAIEGNGFRTLAEGQRVTFLTGSDGRGPRASAVRSA
jgi:CspA family cold shock protein